MSALDDAPRRIPSCLFCGFPRQPAVARVRNAVSARNVCAVHLAEAQVSWGKCEIIERFDADADPVREAICHEER